MITPKDIINRKIGSIPKDLIKAFDNLLLRKYDCSSNMAIITLSEVKEESFYTYDFLINSSYLPDTAILYSRNGWNVRVEGAGCDICWTFTPKE